MLLSRLLGRRKSHIWWITSQMYFIPWRWDSCHSEREDRERENTPKVPDREIEKFLVPRKCSLPEGHSIFFLMKIILRNFPRVQLWLAFISSKILKLFRVLGKESPPVKQYHLCEHFTIFSRKESLNRQGLISKISKNIIAVACSVC